MANDDGADQPAEGQMSKSQQKRLAKEAEKAKKAAEKAAAKAAEAAAQPAAKPKAAAADDDEMDSTKYKEMREAWIRSRKAADLTPYPHKFHTTHTHAAYIKEFSGLAAGERLETEAAIAGRVMLKRESGAKLVFFDLVADGLKVQVLADASIYTGPDFTADMLNIKRGDVIGVRGRPGKSKKGELSILPTTVQMLSPCLHQLPKREITDKEVRYRQRYLDLIVNRPVRDIFLMRTRAINFLRRFLDMHHFIEVETPVLNLLPGGATARPFESYHNELQRKLYMRIAPELFLKMLVVGGLDRVYEIGRLFRNEGIDMTHNPEFTSCEFYWAYADYHDLMAFTEELLSSMVKELTGSYKIAIHPDGDKSGRAVEIDFTPPFRRLPMIKSLEEKLGVKFPADLGQPGAHAFLAEQCKKFNIEADQPTTAKLLDKLVGELLEVECINPTFITDHPVIMSPLAKHHRDDANLTERFELFVNTKELCNAYTELNDPVVQKERFDEQMAQKGLDDEAMSKDDEFVTALEYGLPPTAGWGMGIDRLCMMLTDSMNIKEVLLFPAMKPKDGSGAAAATEASGSGDGA